MINKYLFIGFTLLHILLCFFGFLRLIVIQKKYYIERAFHSGLKLAAGGMLGTIMREIWVMVFIDTIVIDWSNWAIKIAMTLLLLLAINYTRTAEHYSK